METQSLKDTAVDADSGPCTAPLTSDLPVRGCVANGMITSADGPSSADDNTDAREALDADATLVADDDDDDDEMSITRSTTHRETGCHPPHARETVAWKDDAACQMPSSSANDRRCVLAASDVVRAAGVAASNATTGTAPRGMPLGTPDTLGLCAAALLALFPTADSTPPERRGDRREVNAAADAPQEERASRSALPGEGEAAPTAAAAFAAAARCRA